MPRTAKQRARLRAFKCRVGVHRCPSRRGLWWCRDCGRREDRIKRAVHAAAYGGFVGQRDTPPAERWGARGYRGGRY